MMFHDFRRRVLTYAGYIDGAFVNGEGQSWIVENPSNQSIVDELVGASPTQVDKAIAAARIAFDDGRWSRLGRERGKEGLHEFQMVTTFNLGG